MSMSSFFNGHVFPLDAKRKPASIAISVVDHLITVIVRHPDGGSRTICAVSPESAATMRGIIGVLNGLPSGGYMPAMPPTFEATQAHDPQS